MKSMKGFVAQSMQETISLSHNIMYALYSWPFTKCLIDGIFAKVSAGKKEEKWGQSRHKILRQKLENGKVQPKCFLNMNSVYLGLT